MNTDEAVVFSLFDTDVGLHLWLQIKFNFATNFLPCPLSLCPPAKTIGDLVPTNATFVAMALGLYFQHEHNPSRFNAYNRLYQWQCLSGIIGR